MEKQEDVFPELSVSFAQISQEELEQKLVVKIDC
jgi:hypothetical protein